MIIHLMYMDAFKIFNENEKELQNLIQTKIILSQDKEIYLILKNAPYLWTKKKQLYEYFNRQTTEFAHEMIWTR